MSLLTVDLLQVIGECHASGIDNEVAAKYSSISGSQDRELFIEFCRHTMLYQMPPQGSAAPFIVRKLLSLKIVCVPNVLRFRAYF